MIWINNPKFDHGIIKICNFVIAEQKIGVIFNIYCLFIVVQLPDAGV